MRSEPIPARARPHGHACIRTVRPSARMVSNKRKMRTKAGARGTRGDECPPVGWLSGSQVSAP